MPDYKELYYILFQETTKAIWVLRQAQQRAEELYVLDDPAKRIHAVKVCEKEKNEQPLQK